jgi:hypothetical protein
LVALLACLVSLANISLRGQSRPAATDFVILKADDLTPSSGRLTIIVVAARDEAESVHRKLESGASFESLAEQYSKHPSAAAGGDFGVFPISDLPPEFRAALGGVKSGGFTPVIAIQKPAIPAGWPDTLPLPGVTLKDVERTLGRAYSSTKVPADGQSSMTELLYPFGVKLRVHESRGLGFMEFTGAWKTSIFGIRPDDPIPTSIYDLFPHSGRFIRGVYVAVPGHPNWFIDVDERIDAVTRLLFVDRTIYGNLPDLPKGQ